MRIVATPVTFGKTPARIRSMAPEHGQHTEEVLLEAGYSWEEIDSLRGEGVVGPRKATYAVHDTDLKISGKL